MKKQARGYLDWEDGFLKFTECLKRDGLYRENLLINMLCYGALRYSDASVLTRENIKGDKVIINSEEKTGKYKEFPINDSIIEALSLYKIPDWQNEFFLNKKRTGILTRQWFNNWLHEYIKENDIKYYGKVGSHMFRKTFGRRFIERNGDDLSVLMYLKDFLNHSNVETTYVYLGLHQEEMNKLIANV